MYLDAAADLAAYREAKVLDPPEPRLATGGWFRVVRPLRPDSPSAEYVGRTYRAYHVSAACAYGVDAPIAFFLEEVEPTPPPTEE